VLSLQEQLQQIVATHGYWAIALIVGLESMGIPLPGETILVLAAIYAAADPTLNIWFAIAAAAIGSIAGDNAGYWIGRHYAYALLVRYTLTIDKSTIEKRFGTRFYIAQASYEWSPTYNAAPSQLLPIIRTYHEDRIELAKWGFVREDWSNSRIRPQNNARLETADTKPMFRDSFRARHCLVLADSFYEWKTLANGAKQPYRITLKTGEPFAMAGIYAREPTEFETAEKNLVNFAILTTKANEATSHIHDRMPVILPLGRERSWLNGPFIPDFPAELLTSYPVTPKMNKASFNEPEAILPLEPAIH
jgi:putative SOS response-associated peptidase YedK